MPGYGSPTSDPLNFGLSAGGHQGGYDPNPNWNYSFSSLRGPGTGTTSPLGAAKSATTFNLGSVGDIAKLTESLNAMNQAAQKTAQNNRIPNNPALEQQSSTNIGADLKGQLSPTELANLNQAAAERGVSSGIDPSSPNGNAAYLRALGTTEHERMLQGQSELTAAEGRNPIAPVIDSSKYTLTPGQAGELNLGYLTEADRVALERERLAAERFGGRSPGGSGGGGPPTQGGQPGTYGYTPPYGGPTGGDVLPKLDYNQQQWLGTLGTGYPTAGPSTEGGNAPNYANFGQGGQGYPGYDPQIDDYASFNYDQG